MGEALTVPEGRQDTPHQRDCLFSILPGLKALPGLEQAYRDKGINSAQYLGVSFWLFPFEPCFQEFLFKFRQVFVRKPDEMVLALEVSPF